MNFAADSQQRQNRLALTLGTRLRPLVSRVLNRIRRLPARLREFNATQIELQERKRLLDEPWLEELLHWSHNGDHWELHGHLPPPDDRRHSVTPDGWCPARRPAHRTEPSTG